MERQLIQEGATLGDTPIRVLRALHKTIQGHCHESGRRCWEYLVEMLAHSTGWQTESAESKHLWDKMPDEPKFLEFYQAWIAEVQWAKHNGAPFSEPLGQLLEEIEGTNDYHGQFFTPMPVVRMMNSITLADDTPSSAIGVPRKRGLDPACGTGRFMIDALVHNDNLAMNGVDIDLWMLRTAMLNVRMLAPWTTMRVKDPDGRLKAIVRPFNAIEEAVQETRRLVDRMEAMNSLNPFAKEPEPADETGGGDILMVGGRAVFMHGNALVVDLNYSPNWLCAGWAWSPKPWMSNLKIAGYYGTYDEWVEAGKPPLGQEESNDRVQFDYSMRDRAAVSP